jgi:hypothetical protein
MKANPVLRATHSDEAIRNGKAASTSAREDVSGSIHRKRRTPPEAEFGPCRDQRLAVVDPLQLGEVNR